MNQSIYENVINKQQLTSSFFKNYRDSISDHGKIGNSIFLGLSMGYSIPLNDTLTGDDEELLAQTFRSHGYSETLEVYCQGLMYGGRSFSKAFVKEIAFQFWCIRHVIRQFCELSDRNILFLTHLFRHLDCDATLIDIVRQCHKDVDKGLSNQDIQGHIDEYYRLYPDTDYSVTISKVNEILQLDKQLRAYLVDPKQSTSSGEEQKIFREILLQYLLRSGKVFSINTPFLQHSESMCSILGNAWRIQWEF